MQLLDFQEFANPHLQINRRADDLVVIANNTIIKGSPLCVFSRVTLPCRTPAEHVMPHAGKG